MFGLPYLIFGRLLKVKRLWEKGRWLRWSPSWSVLLRPYVVATHVPPERLLVLLTCDSWIGILGGFRFLKRSSGIGLGCCGSFQLRFFCPGMMIPPLTFWLTPIFLAEILHLHSPGYELEHFMQRATSFFIPMGIAVAKDWAAYTVIPDQTTGSFFWWTPDPTFLHFTSRQVEFGKRKPVFFLWSYWISPAEIGHFLFKKR